MFGIPDCLVPRVPLTVFYLRLFIPYVLVLTNYILKGHLLFIQERVSLELWGVLAWTCSLWRDRWEMCLRVGHEQRQRHRHVSWLHQGDRLLLLKMREKRERSPHAAPISEPWIEIGGIGSEEKSFSLDPDNKVSFSWFWILRKWWTRIFLCLYYPSKIYIYDVRPARRRNKRAVHFLSVNIVYLGLLSPVPLP